jgi:hypothetical protein
MFHQRKLQCISVVMGAALIATALKFCALDRFDAAASFSLIGNSKRDGSNSGGRQSATTKQSAHAVNVPRPQIGSLRLANDDVVTSILQRLRLPEQEKKLAGLLHSLHLFGPGLQVTTASGDSSPAIDLICDAQIANRYINTGNVLTKTRYGVRFPEFWRWAVGISQFNAEAHAGQALATFACQGVPLSTPITLEDGVRYRVQHVLDDTVANFTLEGEIFWEAVAIAIYVPPNRSWTNKFGKRFSFDDLVADLIQRPLESSPCCGTHGLIALTMVLNADAVSPVLSDRVRDSLWKHLHTTVDRLVHVESRAGGWSTDWFQRPLDSAQGELATVAPEQILQATGHHLEWLMLLPPKLQPQREIYRRAAQRCLQLLLTQTRDKPWLGEHFCESIHAARSVKLLN